MLQDEYLHLARQCCPDFIDCPHKAFKDCYVCKTNFHILEREKTLIARREAVKREGFCCGIEDDINITKMPGEWGGIFAANCQHCPKFSQWGVKQMEHCPKTKPALDTLLKKERDTNIALPPDPAEPVKSLEQWAVESKDPLGDLVIFIQEFLWEGEAEGLWGKVNPNIPLPESHEDCTELVNHAVDGKEIPEMWKRIGILEDPEFIAYVNRIKLDRIKPGHERDRSLDFDYDGPTGSTGEIDLSEF